MSLAVGQGIAIAAPADSSNASQFVEPRSAADSPADTESTDSTEASEATSVGGYSIAADDDSGTDTDEAPEEEGVGDGAPGETADEAIENEDASDLETDRDGAGADDNQAHAEGETHRESDQPSEPVSLDTDPAADDPASVVGQSRKDAVEPVEGDVPVVESEVVIPAVAVAALAPTDLVPRAAAHSAPTLRSLATARPVTVNSIVTDLLTWVGLGPLANGLPAPTAPVSAFMQSLWLAVRQVQYTLNNQRPTAEVTTSGPGPDGVVSGSLNAVDYDDSVLTYRVTAAPTRGSVAIDALGNFVYTPHAGTSPGGDAFTVIVDDTIGNPFHVHGLLGLLGITGPTELTIVIGPSAARRESPATIDLGDLLSRDGVAVSADSTGALSVIDGRFTDHVVTTADDAAAVMNALAAVLGFADGFADPAAITTSDAGVGSSAENFYRLSETIGGIPVLGSDMILVTDAEGAVTGLFNNYRGLAGGFDVAPADTVDEDVEVYRIAGVAYLGPGADGSALDAFLEQNTFTNQLVVHALDDHVEPRLVWRVVVQFRDTGDMSPPGTTYLIDADGPDAGTVIAAISNVAAASAVTVAKDWLGDERTITVDTSSFLFFTTHKMVDAARGITTYNTSFPFLGLFGPSLPGSVVKRSWLSWDRGAVSAHANTALVYDYFQEVLGRTSFDGAGAPVTVSIRYSPSLPIFGYTNAFWDPTRKLFAYGSRGYLQAALDIVAHEFTHGVVSYVVGDGDVALDYGESGALNEAYADILGALIEGKSGMDRWLIGEDSSYGILRNLANPKSTKTPQGVYRSHYGSRYTGSGDEGGEHVNSTIFSHAAYKMMTAAATSGISDDTWATMFYQSLYRLSPGAVFTDGRAAVVSAATALGFTNAQLAAIRSAFDSVGIIGAVAASSLAA